MKVMTWFLQVFISPKFFNKVVSHDDLATLEMAVPWDELQLPDWVRRVSRSCSQRDFAGLSGEIFLETCSVDKCVWMDGWIGWGANVSQVDEYNRQLYGRPARPAPEKKGKKGKKKKTPLGVRDTQGDL